MGRGGGGGEGRTRVVECSGAEVGEVETRDEDGTATTRWSGSGGMVVEGEGREGEREVGVMKGQNHVSPTSD